MSKPEKLPYDRNSTSILTLAILLFNDAPRHTTTPFTELSAQDQRFWITLAASLINTHFELER
jgi:hypothetical protein